MCLIIHRAPDVAFPHDILESVVQRNGDGFGLMTRDKSGKPLTIRAMADFDTIRSIVKDFDAHPHEIAYHWRMATSGPVDADHAHPFPVIDDKKRGLWLMHNGVLSAGTKEASDTAIYIRDILTPILERDPGLVDVPAFSRLVGSEIGQGNKFVLMDAGGTFRFINRSSGTSYKNCWLSNTYAWTNPANKRFSLYGDDYWHEYMSGGYGQHWPKNNPVNKTKGKPIAKPIAKKSKSTVVPIAKPKAKPIAKRDETPTRANLQYLTPTVTTAMLRQLSVTEIFQEVCDNPDGITDYLADVRWRA